MYYRGLRHFTRRFAACGQIGGSELFCIQLVSISPADRKKYNRSTIQRVCSVYSQDVSCLHPGAKVRVNA